MKNFCAFILSNGRPDNVITYRKLIEYGYTGKIYIVIDDEDKTAPQYIENFGDIVLVFSKDEIGKTFDLADNFNNKKVIVYARNACFQLAKQLGITYFIQLDDDYNMFQYTVDNNDHFGSWKIKNLDRIFSFLLDYYKSTKIKSIALAKGGDLLGGKYSRDNKKLWLKRKAMNSFICSTDREFQFLGRINEDVNTYTRNGNVGDIFLTVMFLKLTQKDTQQNSGGMTDTYIQSGTYVKSFYTLMFCPSFVIIENMHSIHPRLHHKIKWNNAVPMILSPEHRKL